MPEEINRIFAYDEETELQHLKFLRTVIDEEPIRSGAIYQKIELDELVRMYENDEVRFGESSNIIWDPYQTDVDVERVIRELEKDDIELKADTGQSSPRLGRFQDWLR